MTVTRDNPSPAPEASIIIVTYNGLADTTVPCLESVFRNTDGVDFEVIVVDNASTDGTGEHLRRLASSEPRLRVLLNGTNRGFAGGNNDGLRIARGNSIVLLNSDTRVTGGWLAGLVDVLGDPEVGLAGPVSNNVGNEQQIFTEGASPDETIAEGLRWCEFSRGDAFETGMLGFFCVAARRDVVEKVGLLDESFGLGYFEDDDYCMRVRKAGYRLVCVEDAFVYHKGEASFSSMDRADLKSLSRRNRKILEKKHDRPGAGLSRSELQLALVESCLAEGGERAVLKAQNRLRLLERLRPPKGLVRRARYRLKRARLRKLVSRLAASSRH